MPNHGEHLCVETGDAAMIRGEQKGQGTAIVLLHGLTATRRYVVMGSKTLERSGYRVIAYDARGHGHSSAPPSPDAYTYERLATDLSELLDALAIEQAVLVGASMGAQTALRFTIDHPSRALALCLITPAFDPLRVEPNAHANWDELARGLREGGVEGFIEAYELDSVPAGWRDTVVQVQRQRLAAHDHPLAVADALERIPRSRPFESWEELEQIEQPTLVVASRDEADPGHPLAVAQRYAATIAGAKLVVEDAGPPMRSPIAWQGGQLSRLIVQLIEEHVS